MKKIMSLILTIIFATGIAFTFSGCSDTNASLANNIDKTVSQVRSALNKTVEVSNEELVFDNIISLSELENKYPLNEEEKNYTSNPISQKTTTASEKISNKINLANKTRKDMPLPNLKRQIVKNEDLANNTLSLSSKIESPNRLTSRRTSNSSRLTSAYYTPRRVSNVNYNNSNFTNYLGKLEDLYLMMNDAVCANDNITSCKNSLSECCDLLDILSGKLKSNEIQLTDEQVDSCNDLLDEVGGCTNKVTSSRNDVKNECSALKQSATKTGFNVDQISTKYIKLINCLDQRESNYKGLLSSLKQLQCILTGDCYQNSFDSNSDILNDGLLQDNTLNESQIEDNTLNKNKVEDNTLSENKVEDNKLNENPVIEDNTLNENPIIEDKESADIQDDVLENNDELTKNNDVKNEDTVQNQDDVTLQNQQDKKDKELPSEDLQNDNKIENLPYKSKLTDPNYSNETEQNLNEEKKTNIDTYKEQTILPNVIKSRQNKINTETNNQNLVQNNQNTQVPITPVVPTLPNAIPNANTYGNGVYGGMGYGAGLGAQINGIGGYGAGVGGYGAGLGGVGTGIGGIYNGIHNFENGITNPFRNTDTYKLSLSGQPLPSETRRNFKPFSEINFDNNQNIKIAEKTALLTPSDTEIIEDNNTRTTIINYKLY